MGLDKSAQTMNEEAWAHALRVVEPSLALADPRFLEDIGDNLECQGIRAAIRRRDTPALYDWLISSFQHQGVADEVVRVYQEANRIPSWLDLEAELIGSDCLKLQSYWHYAECGLRKSAWTCQRPALLNACPVGRYPFRNGRLAQASFSFFLFVRDISGGDIVGFIDERLQFAARLDVDDRPKALREALLEPLRYVHGVSDKSLSLALSAMLLGGDPNRPLWVEAGGAMIAIDTLVHNFFHRTGVLKRLRASHAYGDRCYSTGGCADIVEGLATRVDARCFNSRFPENFPRFVQHSIWRFCSASRFNICNGNQIDDRLACGQVFCPSWQACDRFPLAPLQQTLNACRGASSVSIA